MSGTSEEAGQAPAQEAGAPKGMPPAVAEKLAEIRAREGVKPDGFAELAQSVGIDVTSTPKPAPAEAAPEGTSDGEVPVPVEGDTPLGGMEAILEAAKAPNTRLEADNAIEQEALSKGLPAGMAKALAKNTPRKEAREFLDSYGNGVQSGPAGQPAPQPAEVPSAGSPPVAAPVVDSQALTEALGSEEAATAVAGVISDLQAQVQEAKAAAQQATQFVQQGAVEQQMRSVEQEAAQAAGELRERFPGLVRDGAIDPRVAELAGVLRFQTSQFGDMKGAMEAAALSVFGAGAPRQQPTIPTQSPDLEAPPALSDVSGGPIDLHTEQDILGGIAKRYRDNPALMRQELKRARLQIDRRNRSARR